MLHYGTVDGNSKNSLLPGVGTSHNKSLLRRETVRRKINRKQLTLALSLGGLLLGTRSFLAGDDGNTDRNNQFDFALIGDVPYAPTSGVVPNKYQTYPSPEYNNVIGDINNHNKVLFTVHMGDIKAGDTWCAGGNPTKDPAAAANVYTNNLTLFNSFRTGVVYLPGDNEWTDCHRTNNGAYNPLERLAYLRNQFFVTNLSLGQRPITLTRQSSDAGFELYKENVMWRTGSILFVGINHLEATTITSGTPALALRFPPTTTKRNTPRATRPT